VSRKHRSYLKQFAFPMLYFLWALLLLLWMVYLVESR
jgi:hypothetical protein